MGYVQIMGYIGAFTVDNSITNSPQGFENLTLALQVPHASHEK